ncbi:MAG: type III pantothenate kinase [Planctomycetota bacterium]
MIGNTHASVAQWRESGRADPSVKILRSDASSVRRLVSLIVKDSQSVVVAGVVPRLKALAVSGLKKKRCGEVFVFRRNLMPKIEIVPDPPQQVGDDRIAIALGALAIDATTSCIVVDVGTALTCNVVTPARDKKRPRFEGGLIMPGAALSLKALAQNTAQLPLLDVSSNEPRDFNFIGRNTAQAMRWGVVVAQVAALLAMIEGQKRTLGQATRVIITGGGAMIIKDALKLVAPTQTDFLFHPTLAHLGLFAAWRA